jgi:hypothetical protein
MFDIKVSPENPVAILGCPRSGTGYSARFFDLGHERMNENGIASWYLVSGDPVRGPSLREVEKEYDNLTIFHQVRNPIDTIPSLMTMSYTTWKYFAKNIGFKLRKSKIKNGMLAWYYWNIMSEEITEKRYKLEEMDNLFVNHSYSNKKHNARDHQTLTEEDFKRADEELWNNIKGLAIRYGYDI